MFIDISKCFAKKKDVSDNSNNGYEARGLQEDSLAGSNSSNSPGDVF